MNKKSIIILTSIFPPDIGGVPSYYKNLLCRLRFFNPVVLTQATKTADIKVEGFCGVSGIEVIRGDLYPDNIGMDLDLNWVLKIFKLSKFIIKKHKEKEVAFIVVGQAAMFVLIVAYLVSRIIDVPFVVYFHGEEIPQLRLKSNFILKWLFLKGFDYFSNSYFTNERVRRFLGKEEFFSSVVYPGVEERFFEEKDVELKRKLLHLEGKRIIYTIARLDERKGQDKVIEALPVILKKYPNVVYLIGGGGPRFGYLNALVEKMRLKDHVRFLGLVPEEELVIYHRIGEVFVHPNRTLEDGDTEGFGIVFLEANAAGNPVIGGRAGGAVEAVVDGVTGLLVNPVDPIDIADKICFLLENREASERMGRNGKERAWQQFRWPRLAETFEKRLMEMCVRLEDINLI